MGWSESRLSPISRHSHSVMLASIHPSLSLMQDSADGSSSLTAEEVEALERRRQSRSNYHLTSGHAAVELFLRLNHARQTLDFVKRQVGVEGRGGAAGRQAQRKGT